MRAQSIVISAYLAVIVFILVFAILYVLVYPKTTTKVFEYKQLDIIRLIRTKTYWSACELASSIASEFGADYVYVNITVVDLVDNEVINKTSCYRRPVNIREEELTYFVYHFTRLTRNGVMYIYDIEVGVR